MKPTPFTKLKDVVEAAELFDTSSLLRVSRTFAQQIEDTAAELEPAQAQKFRKGVAGAMKEAIMTGQYSHSIFATKLAMLQKSLK